MLKVVVCSEPPDETEGEAGADGVDEAAGDVDCERVSTNAAERRGGENEGAY